MLQILWRCCKATYIPTLIPTLALPKGGKGYSIKRLREFPQPFIVLLYYCIIIGINKDNRTNKSYRTNMIYKSYMSYMSYKSSDSIIIYILLSPSTYSSRKRCSPSNTT